MYRFTILVLLSLAIGSGLNSMTPASPVGTSATHAKTYFEKEKLGKLFIKTALRVDGVGV